MYIRLEEQGDEDRLYQLTKAAFEHMSFSNGTEADALNRLRQDGDLALSLVAEEGHLILGHVAFSPVQLNGAAGSWYGLGPISVQPDHQKQGIGRLLIETGLKKLQEKNAAGCVLIGDPAFYGRFGFQSHEGLSYRDIPAQYVQGLSLLGPGAKPVGEITFSPGLEAA